ncbi:hypothetical protein QWY85_00660 [Neolewinella lacunae]|uniref:Tetratricopeptide repeat protein n=1 Tax=Neolewinella lacunae TaxID=1517758 RepID=A0A923PFI2_9BACT|nr:hypothetical protein [Neolewinella lacunae]MBC6993122.1 hypothetical protein [Neolewinella lacunae]MDN3633144.1 hypothetical protein [Neolewinella lacunae]
MQINLSFTHLLLALLAVLCSCTSKRSDEAREHYFEERNKLHDGDYLATYPLHSPDSSIIRLRAEVLSPYQPWGCMGLWYRMPHTNRDSSFRLLELYERYYPHDTVRAFAQLKRAEFYVDAAQFAQADTCLREVEQISLRLNRTLDLSDVYFLRGRIAMYRNDFSQSRQALFKYIELLDGLDPAFSQAHALAYHSIAVSYERARQYESMLAWINRLWTALQLHDDYWVPRLKAQTALLAGIGQLGVRPDSSLQWANQAERIIREDLQLPPPARLSYLFGRAYSELEQCDAALPYLLAAYQQRPGAQTAFGHYQYAMALGQAYLCVGRLDSAVLLLNESLASPDTGNLAASHQMLGEIAQQQGNYKKAWEHQKTCDELLKAKFTSDRINAAAETDARYEALVQSKRVTELENQHHIHRLRLIALMLCIFLLIGTGISFYLRHKQHRRMLAQHNELLKQEKQLVELRAQLKEEELAQSQEALLQTKDELLEAESLLNFKNQLINTLELRLLRYDKSKDASPIPAHPVKAPFPEAQEAPFSEMRILTKEEWRYFQEKFSAQFPNFLQHLQSCHPALTPAEKRLIILIKIGFDTPQIAGMLGIADSSVWRSRNRLVKSLNLDSAKNLDHYIRQSL